MKVPEVAVRPAESSRDYSENQTDFADRDDDLHVTADFHAEIIQDAEQKDKHAGEYLAERDIERSDAGDGMFELGMEIGEIEKEGGGESRDGAAFRDPHLSPAVKKAPEGPVGFAQVDVLAARSGHGGRELGVRERAGERHESAHDPDDEDHGGRPDDRGGEANIGHGAKAGDHSCDGVIFAYPRGERSKEEDSEQSAEGNRGDGQAGLEHRAPFARENSDP